MKRLVFSWACLFAAALIPALTAPAQETVDFAAAPAKGLKFKVVTKTTSESQRTMTRNEDEPRESKSSSKGETIYIQTILAVKDGKVIGLERRYEDASTTMTREGGGGRRRRGGEGRGDGPQERESPVAWKHFRVTWSGEDEEETAKVEVKDDDEWSEPDDQLKRRVPPKMFRRPLFPLPKGEKQVGDSWELSEEDAKALAPRRGRGGRGGRRGRGGRGGRRGGGGEEQEDERQFTTSIEFTEITKHREMKCAVLKGKLTIENGDTAKTTTSMTAYYSLEHRIIVEMKRESTNESERTFERGEMSMSMSSQGESSSTVRVEVLEKGESAESE